MRYAVQVTVLQLSLNSVHPRSVGEKTKAVDRVTKGTWFTRIAKESRDN